MAASKVLACERPWTRTGEELEELFATDLSNGLSSAAAASRLAEYGPNALAETRRRSLLAILATQFQSILVVLLTLAAGASLLFAQWIEAGAVLAVLVINAVIGFMTEVRAVRSMEALRSLGVATAVIRRDGTRQQVDARELVAGDLVLVEGGDLVSADIRLTEASRLQANESLLTGEALPVGKRLEAAGADADIADRKCMIYRGTAITRGAGAGIVVATGLSTEVGHISELVAGAEAEHTPLEKRLNKLGQALVWVTLALAVVIGGIGLINGTELSMAIQTAIALAVASVPEGLPIIATLALARGMRKMVAHKALVNRLSAVETLGATSIICTDKTGTLTENKMTVALYELGHGAIELAPDKDIDPQSSEGLEQAIRIGILCNDASLDGGGIGDPLEVALLRAGQLAGRHKNELRTASPRVREIAFDSDIKMMATVQELGDQRFEYTIKGAPESVLAHCTQSATGGELTEGDRQRWLDLNQEHGSTGLRLLGLALKIAPGADADPYQGLTWLGLVALQDPPRSDVIKAVKEVQAAGLRLVMVTGDQLATAASIAEQVGFQGQLEAKLGADVQDWRKQSSAKQDELAASAVFARVSPEQKLELVTLHQQRGAVVAMTGDGVNDAPALRKADIGIAMGQRGTAVAREAADMVLLDDSFSSIVEAIREGRTIFANIRSFVVYLLSCNLSEIMVVGLATVLGGGLPLLPLQILFLNLVTDVFPALALGANAGDPVRMRQPPRAADESIVGRQQWIIIALFGLILTASVLGAFLVAQHVLGYSHDQAVGVSFITIALAQLIHVFNIRPAGSHWLRNEVVQNRWVWGAIALCVVLVAAAVYVPPLARVLSVEAPSSAGWLLVAAGCATTWLLGQLVVALRRR